MSMDLPSEPHSGEPGGSLKRNVIGAGGIGFLVVAAAAPLMVMAGVAPLAILVGGVGAPAGYLAAGVVLTIFAVAFTAMTKHVRNAGAFYSYITRGLGRGLGLASALLALLSYSALQIGVYGLLAVQTQAALADLFGIQVAWPVIAVVGIVLVTAICWFGVDLGVKLLGVLLVAESAVLALMSIAIVARGGASGFSFESFTWSAATGPGMAAILGICFAAYMGFESTAIYRAEARNPDRSIPRATYGAVISMAVFYAFVVWTVVQAFGGVAVVDAAAADLPGLFFGVITTYVGPWAASLMEILVVTSCLASQIAFHNAVTRYALAMSRDGVLPAAAGRVHPRHGSPTTAGLVQSALAVVVVLGFAVGGGDPFSGLLVLVNTPGVVGIILLQGITAVAVVVFFLRPDRPARNPVAVAAGIASVVLLGAAIYLLVTNLDLFTAASATVNTLLLLPIPVILAVGVGAAAWLRRARPEVYARIGCGIPDAGESVPAPVAGSVA